MVAFSQSPPPSLILSLYFHPSSFQIVFLFLSVFLSQLWFPVNFFPPNTIISLYCLFLFSHISCNPNISCYLCLVWDCVCIHLSVLWRGENEETINSKVREQQGYGRGHYETISLYVTLPQNVFLYNDLFCLIHIGVIGLYSFSFISFFLQLVLWREKSTCPSYSLF